MVSRASTVKPATPEYEPSSPDTVSTPVTGPPERSLRVNISWTMLGNLVYAGTQWGALAILARLGTPEVVGEFAAAIALTAPIMLLSNLQLRAVQATDARGENEFGDFFALRIVTTLAALAVIGGIVAFGDYSSSTAALVMLVAGTKAIESFCDLCYGLFQKQERMDLIARSFLLRGPAGLIGMAIGMAATGDIVWGMCGMLIAWGAVLLAGDFPNLLRLTRRLANEKIAPRWNRTRLLKLAGLALPVGLVAAVISLQTNIPRYFLEFHLGKHDLGLFAAMAYLLFLGTTFCQAVNQTALPRLARFAAADERGRFRSLLGRLVLMGAGIGVAGIGVVLLLGQPLMTLMYGPEYAVHQQTLIILMTAGAVRYATFPVASAVRAMRRFWLNFACNGCGLVVLTVACMWLVPRYGMNGAAWAVLANFSFNAIAYAIALRFATRSNRTVARSSSPPRSDQTPPVAAAA